MSPVAGGMDRGWWWPRVVKEEPLPPMDLRPCALNMVTMVEGRFVALSGEEIAQVLEAAARQRQAEEEAYGEYGWW